MAEEEKRVVIVGGGFGGVTAALVLARARVPGLKIVVVSDKPHLEYTSALYRLVTGRSPLEVCIPLRDVFEGLQVEVDEDVIDNIELDQNLCWGKSGSRYRYDYLVIAVGSETSYYNTPGLRELAFGFKSINEALALKRHLHEVFSECARTKDKGAQVCQSHFVIVGGGATGTEVAGELAVYAKKLAKMHGVDESLVTIDVIQSPNRVMPLLPEDMSRVIEKRLRSLGANVYLNRRVVKEDVENVYMKDMEMKAKTLIWTAGVQSHWLLKQTKGLEVDDKGRMVVDRYLRSKGHKNVFGVGDVVASEYAGMAQTANDHGKAVGKNILRELRGEKLLEHKDKKPIYAIPVGPGWAAVLWGERRFYGLMGWTLRRLADLRFFMSILPLMKAIAAWRYGGMLTENCPACLSYLEAGGKERVVVEGK